MTPPGPPIRGVYRTDHRARAAYAEGAGIYRIVPEAVCVPADAGDLPPLIQWAERNGMSLVPRGAGSAMGGGNVGSGVIVDLARLREPEPEIDPAARTARAGAAVTLAELNAAAARHKLRLPPDPSSAHWATLGGMVSTNAAGARSLRYGSVRPWVRGLELVTGGGKVVWMERRNGDAGVDNSPVPPFPRTRKNSSGYALDQYARSGDPIDLVIGAEGTLGFVTRIEWRLDPMPRHTAALRLTLAGLDAIPGVVAALEPLEPSAIELLDRSFLDIIATAPRSPEEERLVRAAGAVVLVEFEGDDPSQLRSEVEAASRAVRPLVVEAEAGLAPEEVERLWKIRHGASPTLAGLPEDRRSLQVIEDACVPVARIGDYIRAVRNAAGARELDVVIFGHAGDGNIHVNLLPRLGRGGWEQDVAAVYEEVADAVLRLGGTFTGEHGDGRLRAPLLERLYGLEVVALFRQVKTAFDPHGIFNPGVILSDGTPPIRRLKAGAGAVPLPADIAAGLRDIERGRGYSRSRLELADGGRRS